MTHPSCSHVSASPALGAAAGPSAGTSAGTAASLDCCLYLVRQYYGSAIAILIVVLGVVISQIANRIFKEKDY